MSIFGLGVSELLLVAVIAMIVAGPKRLMAWMYILGRFLGQLRVIWRQAMEQVQKELDEAGIDFQVPKDPMNRTEMQRFAQKALQPLREPMEKAMREVDEERKKVQKSIREPSQALADAVSEMSRNSTPIPNRATTGTNTGTPSSDAPAPADESPTDLGTGSAASGEESPAASPRPAGFGTWTRPSQNGQQEG